MFCSLSSIPVGSQALKHCTNTQATCQHVFAVSMTLLQPAAMSLLNSNARGKILIPFPAPNLAPAAPAASPALAAAAASVSLVDAAAALALAAAAASPPPSAAAALPLTVAAAAVAPP
mmetsp:Transcript_17814/g.49747  ORF Transcript_17814/g.49747 Transcript_17814/m.49747 type:complete len:118 (+) Transcript_17814:163-516(+)